MDYIVNKPNFHENIGLATQISSDQDVYLHRHEYYEIFYILNGSIGHNCNNLTERLMAGDFFILRPNDVHQFIRNDNEKCSHRDILISVELFEQTMNFLNPEFFNRLKKIPTPFKTNIDVNKIKTFENILNSFNPLGSNETNIQIDAKCVLTNILSDLFLMSKNNIVNYSQMPSLIKKIISLLNTTDGIFYGIPSVINQYNYSPIYLSRIFKKYMGITMSDYLKNVRLNYAELYLQTTSLTLEEITEQIGLQSTSYLNKIFKEKHGTTPNKYRTLYRKTVANANQPRPKRSK